MLSEVPHADQPVGLTAAHRLVESPNGTRQSRARNAEAECDLCHQRNEAARWVRDLSVVSGLRVRSIAFTGLPEHGVVQRHLDVVYPSPACDDFVTEAHGVPPRRYGS